MPAHDTVSISDPHFIMLQDACLALRLVARANHLVARGMHLQRGVFAAHVASGALQQQQSLLAMAPSLSP